jgi:hypothetical protein
MAVTDHRFTPKFRQERPTSHRLQNRLLACLTRKEVARLGFLSTVKRVGPLDAWFKTCSVVLMPFSGESALISVEVL